MRNPRNLSSHGMAKGKYEGSVSIVQGEGQQRLGRLPSGGPKILSVETSQAVG
jgi:hypothetical protein